VGIERAFLDYVGVRPDQKLLLIGPDIELAHQVRRLLENASVHTSFVNRETPYLKIESDFANHDAVVFLEECSSTYSGEVREWLAKGLSKTRFFRLFDFSKELFQVAFEVPLARIKSLNNSLINAGRACSIIKVKSSAGTDLEIRLERRYGWINSYGAFTSTKPGVLPAGEVATFSNHINGILVADGAINTNFGYPADPRLKSSPITVEINNSVGEKFYTDSVVNRLLLRSFLALPFSNHVGEVGLGTNVGLANFVPFVSHINERFPALHLGFGANNQGEKLVPWHCPFHLDLILHDCEIWFDEEMILKNGHYSEAELLTKPPASDVLIGFADTI
jgi:aminopeptidase